MKLRTAFRHRLLAMAGGAAIALLAACASPPIARQGDLIRITPEEGDRIQGSLVESGPDSITIAAVGGGVSLARVSIERLELDRRVRSPWVRFWECATFAMHGGSAVSEIRSEDATRAAIFSAIAAVGGWMCLRPHSWVRARLPDLPNPPTALPDSMSPGR